jgi:hypothetical protein
VAHRQKAGVVMTCCRSYHMRVSLNRLRTRVMMTGGCCELVSTTRYRDRKRSVAREGRDCERQTFCRERANQVPSLAQMSGEKTRDVATDVIRLRIEKWSWRKSQVVSTSKQQMLLVSVVARPLARSFRGLVFNLRRAATLARSSTIRPHRVAGSPLGRLPC